MMSTVTGRWGWLWLVGLALGALPALLWGLGLAWQGQPPSQQALSLVEQAGLVLAVYGFKPLYMLLALAALAMTWGERSPALLALQGSLAAFWAGELFCWINILFFVEETLVFEYLHSLLMVVCVGLLFYSVMEAVDHDLLHFSNPGTRCALAGICQGCVKAQRPGLSARTCLLRRFFQWMMPLAAVLALMPLMAQPLEFSYATRVFGLARTLTHLAPIQWYELRFSPLAALFLISAAWLALAWRGHTPGGLQLSKILLSAGAGQLGFTFMRLALAAFYRESLAWFVFWEELTELLLVLGVLITLLLFIPARLARWRAAFSKWVT